MLCCDGVLAPGANMSVRAIFCVLLSLLFSGCSIHPVPEEVTGVDTYHIARQIRCETREALIDFLMSQFKRMAKDGNSTAHELALRYEGNRELISDFHPNLFKGPNTRHFYNIIYTSAIAYSFDLTMSEDNNLGLGANLLGPWQNPFTLGLGANGNRQRSNERLFTLTDNFQFLLARLNHPKPSGLRYCDNQIAGPNFVYPIAGQIGVHKTMKTFFELTILAALSGDATTKPGAVDTPTMTDILKFTTTVDFTGSPRVVFAPIGNGLQFTDASATGYLRRSDVHQVTIALAVTPSVMLDIGPLRGFLFWGRAARANT